MIRSIHLLIFFTFCFFFFSTYAFSQGTPTEPAPVTDPLAPPPGASPPTSPIPGDGDPHTPIEQSAYWILGNIKALPVSTNTANHPTAIATATRIIHFYIQALTYGKIPNKDYWYTPTGSLSPEYISCVERNNPDEDCSAGNVHFAALKDYAMYYQCRPEAAAPALIVMDHYINSHQRMFRIAGDPRYSQQFFFFRPRSGLNALERLNGATIETSSINQLYLEAIQYYPSETNDLTGLALNDIEAFDEIVERFLSLTPPDVPVNAPAPHLIQKDTFYRVPVYDVRLRFTSIQSPVDCVWDPSLQQYRFIFRTGDYWTDGFADGTPPLPDGTAGGWDFHDGDGSNSGPIDYTPRDPDDYRDVPGYIPPGQGDDEWENNPDNPSNGEDGEDGEDNGSDFCARDPLTGDCTEDPVLTIEDASTFSEIAGNIRIVLSPLFDVSALSGSKTCPSWTLAADTGSFAFSQNIDIDCKWLSVAGYIMMLMASLVAFRIVFGD